MREVVVSTQTPSAIHLYSGGLMDPLNPQAEDICIEDIAHALANLCRFGGHTKEFYSVAQHSLYVSMYCPSEYVLWGLLHDAAEVYVGDMLKPLKKRSGTFGEMFCMFEDAILKVIIEKFGLSWPMPQAVSQTDLWMLCAEARDLCGNPAWAFNLRAQVHPPLESVQELEPWSPALAETQFLLRYYRLLVGEV